MMKNFSNIVVKKNGAAIIGYPVKNTQDFGIAEFDNNGKLLPSIGAGFRYAAFPENKMNVGIDIAAGKDDWGVYFRIGESFQYSR